MWCEIQLALQKKKLPVEMSFIGIVSTSSTGVYLNTRIFFVENVSTYWNKLTRILAKTLMIDW